MSESPEPESKMPRRRFLAIAIPALACAALARDVPGAPKLSVMTVRGRIDADRLGSTLMHEHVMVDFIGADKVSSTASIPVASNAISIWSNPSPAPDSWTAR